MWEAKRHLLLEMYENPNDLAVVITEDSVTGKLGFYVSRGPELGYKVLLTYLPFADTLAEVIKVVKQLFDRVLAAGSQEQDEDATGDTKISSTKLIEEILNKLQMNREVRTF